MAKGELKNIFMDIIKDGLGYISQIASVSILSSLMEGAEIVIDTVEERLVQIEKRIMRKLYSFFLIGFGGIFLIFALHFFLIEYLDWTKTISFLSIGVVIFVTGLIVKLTQPAK